MAVAVGMTSVVQDVFRRALRSKRQFLIIAERCSLQGWPDRKAALRNAFRLQELFSARDELRFEYMTATFDSEQELRKAFSSVASISQRLNAQWNDADEEALKRSNQAYTELLAKIRQCKASLGSDADEALKAAERDLEYRAARQAVHEELSTLDDKLTLYRSLFEE